MIVISANRKSLYYRALVLTALWVFFFYFYNQLIQGEKSFLEIINVIFLGLVLLFYTPVIIITTLFRTVKVTITPDALIVSRILMGAKTLSFTAIDSFSTTSFYSANGRHERVVVTYQGKKKLKIADVNIETIVPILEALRDNNVSYTGHTEREAHSLRLRKK